MVKAPAPAIVKADIDVSVNNVITGAVVLVSLCVKVNVLGAIVKEGNVVMPVPVKVRDAKLVSVVLVSELANVLVLVLLNVNVAVDEVKPPITNAPVPEVLMVVKPVSDKAVIVLPLPTVVSLLTIFKIPMPLFTA